MCTKEWESFVVRLHWGEVILGEVMKLCVEQETLQRKVKTCKQCCQISREKQASGPMKTSQKQAASLVVVKKKKREIITLCTHINITLDPEMYCIVSCFYYCCYRFTIVFCFSSRTSKQYDIQYKRKNTRLQNIYKQLYRKTSPKSLMISGLGNCACKEQRDGLLTLLQQNISSRRSIKVSDRDVHGWEGRSWFYDLPPWTVCV